MVEHKVITKDWTLDEIDLLITLVKQNPELYDQSRPGYSNINVLEKCWYTIADCMQTKDVQLCRAKWQILRGCYRSRHTGGRGSKAWPYYKSLTFLNDYIKQRKSTRKTETSEHENDDYFETLILDQNIDYDDCSRIKTEENNSAQESFSAYEIDKSKENVSPFTIEEALADYFQKRKTKSSIHLFLQSMEEDIAKLSPKGLRCFKKDILQLLEKHLESEGKDKI